MDFNARLFQEALATESLGRFMLYRATVTSTTELGRREADEGGASGTIVLAEEQTAGKARRGRDFHSPPGGNLYFTVLVRGESLARAPLPLAVPVAVIRAFRSSGLQAQIKWPDDIWVGERKLGATMIDLITGAGTPTALIGVGLNVNGDPATRHPELENVATSVHKELGHELNREHLLAQLCNELESAIEEPALAISEAYRSHSMMIGHQVVIRDQQGSRIGTALDIDQEGALIVKGADGVEEQIFSSDVFVIRREDLED